MVRFADDATKTPSLEAGEHLFTIYEVNEKVSKAGNDYWQVKVEAVEGGRVCDNLMFNGKPASKTLAFLTALGLADGENFPTTEFKPLDIVGMRLYIDVQKGDDGYLKFPWSSKGYKNYKTQNILNSSSVEEIPF